MPRLLGVDIPNNRPTVVSLTYLYGVGPRTARDLCYNAGIDQMVRALTGDEYQDWVNEYEGPNCEYEWDTGIAP